MLDGDLRQCGQLQTKIAYLSSLCPQQIIIAPLEQDFIGAIAANRAI
jgi:hypothetical protein